MDSYSLGHFDPYKLLLYQFFHFGIFMVRTNSDTFYSDYNSTSQDNKREKKLNAIAYSQTRGFHTTLYFDTL